MEDFPLKLYTFFHLNLAYSSIEESRRAEVIEKCYWPLLELAETPGIPLGIEASAYTLEAIAAADAGWIDRLRRLADAGRVTCVGSGYAQMIGPLVPAAVNAANLAHGMAVYGELLGREPEFYLVNEQAYSAGMLEHYERIGSRAILMEWDNPAVTHPFWNSEWRYLPQLAKGRNGEQIPVIWNNSIAFQKFQHFAHGEIGRHEYCAFLEGHLSSRVRAFPIYGNDAEVFDFRPGRFHTEAALSKESEWGRIRELLELLKGDARFEFVSIESVLGLLGEAEAGNKIELESSVQPVPVKKQRKYNITRWAVTGRDDLGINTRCWRLFERLRSLPPDAPDWRELCYLWSSDFRTHITPGRWGEMIRRLEAFEQRLHAGVASESDESWVPVAAEGEGRSGEIEWEREGRFLTVDNGGVRVTFNCRRGLSVERFGASGAASPWLFGTLPHGYFDDIGWSDDVFSGCLYSHALGSPEITDLEPCEPLMETSSGGAFRISTIVPTSQGPIAKSFLFEPGGRAMTLRYVLGWKELAPGVLRLGYAVLNPEAFDFRSLFYRTHNGGSAAEQFRVDREIDHGLPVSFLVSANEALGLTEGYIDVGDRSTTLRISANKHRSALIAMVKFKPVHDRYLLSVCFSARENDETVRLSRSEPSIPLEFELCYELPVE